MKKVDTYNRSRIEILNYILNFSTTKYYGDGVFSRSLSGLHFVSIDNHKVEVGSLCLLQSAPFTKFYLCWLKDSRKREGHYFTEYLMESIEDRSLCWWSNVQLVPYNKEESDKHPEWRWSDRQFEFWDRWERACKRRDAYITLPVMPSFGDGFEVTIGTRTRFSMNNRRPTKTFPDWRKVTFKQMLEFYDEASKSDK